MTESCFVCIHRENGGKDDIDQIGREKRRFLASTGAVYVGTERADAHKEEAAGRGRRRTWAWDDWYEVLIPKGQTLANITAICRFNGIHDGPYWGCGREGLATGQTKKPGSHSEARHH